MTRFTQLQRLLCGVACAATLSGCLGTAPVLPPPPPPTLAELMAQADKASTGGQKEQALKLLKQAAEANPKETKPWLDSAQINFDGGKYGEAILDAQQGLARDPTSVKGHSIIAISGLRLATEAVDNLVKQNNLTGTTKTESQELAKLLRESVGETVIIKPPTKGNNRGRGGNTGIVKPVTPPKDDAADPFGGLR